MPAIDFDGLYDELEELLSQNWFRRILDEDRAHPNFWQIIEYGKNSYEIRYSRMIRWLLDPAENHGLGPFVARRVAELALNGRDQPFREQLGDSYAADESDGAETEALKAKSGGIDVLYHEKNLGLCLAIENKMFTDEHVGKGGERSQLENYAEAIEQHPEFRQYRHRVFIFLTGDGHEPSAVVREKVDQQPASEWFPMSYQDLNDILAQAYARLGSVPGVSASETTQATHARKIIEDFIVDNRRNFMGLDAHGEELEGFTEYRGQLDQLHAVIGDHQEEQETTSSDEESDALVKEFRARFAGDLEPAKRAVELVQKAVSVGEQDHTPNSKVQRIIRMMFNGLVGEESQLGLGSTIGHEPKSDRQAEVVNDRFRALGIVRARVTRGKGQGLHFIFARSPYFIYISGDRHGVVYNHICKILVYGGGEDDLEANGVDVLVNKDRIHVTESSEEKLRTQAQELLDLVAQRLEGLRESNPQVRALIEESVRELGPRQA